MKLPGYNPGVIRRSRRAFHDMTTTLTIASDAQRRISYFADLIFVLVQKEMKVRYKNSALGYAWSVANPLLFTAVYYVALGVFLRFNIPGYPFPLFLIAGQFPWQWLSNSVNSAPMVFLANASLIKKVRFPRHVLVASSVLNDAIHFLLSVPVIALLLLWYGFVPSWSWVPGIPLLAFAQFLTVYGAALAAGSVNVFFRDLERLVGIFLQALFFLTPIVYSASIVPPRYQVWIRLNPVAPLIRAWQKLFLDGHLDPLLVAAAYLSGLICLAVGSLTYRALSPRFGEIV
jgi:homopolymeric O-antigen transport system permease protein